jgi:hypothetical protein
MAFISMLVFLLAGCAAIGIWRVINGGHFLPEQGSNGEDMETLEDVAKRNRAQRQNPG